MPFHYFTGRPTNRCSGRGYAARQLAGLYRSRLGQQPFGSIIRRAAELNRWAALCSRTRLFLAKGNVACGTGAKSNDAT